MKFNRECSVNVTNGFTFRFPSFPMNATARLIENNAAIHDAVQRVVLDSLESCPANTKKNYLNKQAEWRGWCDGRGFGDGNVVTEGKLLLFIKEFVEPRGSRKVEGDEVKPLSNDGLEGYVKAVVDLYKIQQTLGLNTHPHPRGKALKEYLRARKRQTNKRKRDLYTDRGAGTVLDTYRNARDFPILLGAEQRQGIARSTRFPHGACIDG